MTSKQFNNIVFSTRENYIKLINKRNENGVYYWEAENTDLSKNIVINEIRYSLDKVIIKDNQLVCEIMLRFYITSQLFNEEIRVYKEIKLQNDNLKNIEFKEDLTIFNKQYTIQFDFNIFENSISFKNNEFVNHLLNNSKKENELNNNYFKLKELIESKKQNIYFDNKLLTMEFKFNYLSNWKEDNVLVRDINFFDLNGSLQFRLRWDCDYKEFFIIESKSRSNKVITSFKELVDNNKDNFLYIISYEPKKDNLLIALK